MIVIDTSALFALAARETERAAFFDILDRTDAAFCSTVTYVETTMVLTGRSRIVARDKVQTLIEDLKIEVVPLDSRAMEGAIVAFDKFGKGRHRARLNFSDCFSYGLAKSRNLPLLFKGDDFIHTDIVPAWRP